MFASLRKLYELSSRRERVRLGVLVGMMVVAALLEVVGIGAIPAFVELIVAPEGIEGSWGEWIPAPLRAMEGEEFIVWAVLALIGVLAVKSGFLVLFYHFEMGFIRDCRADLARRLVNAYMHAPYRFHLERNTTELMRNVERETAIIAHQVLAALLELSMRLLILLAVLAFLLAVEPWITLAWLVVFGSMATVGVMTLSSRLKRSGLAEQECRQKVLQALAQGFGSIKESRIMNREQFFADVASGNVRRMSDAIRFKTFIGSAMNPATELIAVTGLLVIATVLVVSGRSTTAVLATLSLFVVGLVRLRETASSAMTHLANVRYNVVAVDPVHADLVELETHEGEDQPTGAAAPPADGARLSGDIELRDVHFRYRGAGRDALSGIDLRIPYGAAVGFVGGTGAGKSTLVDLILGLLEPDRGQILVDGVDIHAGNLRSWQRTVGYVPQAIYLLDDTIRNNIALGRDADQIDAELLARAVRAAQIEALVERLPDGLDTRIGEHGARLSGGERQRIGIARALYTVPQVLVMDEATSALDHTTERAVIESVEALKGRRTVIMITHRLSTVKNCDILCLLSEGGLVAVGSYDELRSTHADFCEMASG